MCRRKSRSDVIPIIEIGIVLLIQTLGATLVFPTKTVNQRLLDSMLGFAGGVMIAASYWSLLGPAIEMSADNAVGLGFQQLL